MAIAQPGAQTPAKSSMPSTIERNWSSSLIALAAAPSDARRQQLDRQRQDASVAQEGERHRVEQRDGDEGEHDRQHLSVSPPVRKSCSRPEGRIMAIPIAKPMTRM